MAFSTKGMKVPMKKGPMGHSGGTMESKINTGAGDAMLGKHMKPPSDPTASGKPKGTDMSTPPKSGQEYYEGRGMGITAHVHGSKKC